MSSISDNGPPSNVECSECNKSILIEESYFQSSKCEAFKLCRDCSLSSTDYKEHDMHPCFIDRRDSRITFLTGPSLNEYRYLDEQAQLNISFKHPSSSRKFLCRVGLINHSKHQPVDNRKYEDICPEETVGIKKIRNDSFRFERLDRVRKEIRVAALLAGSENEPIKLTITKIAPPWSLGSFTALSYCWGSLEEIRSICIRDASRDSSHPKSSEFDSWEQFACSANLEMALRAIRRQHETQTFWIDAICINQNDAEECAYQVSLMSEIYASASRMKIWLGRDPVEREAAYQIQNLSEAAREVRQMLDSAVHSLSDVAVITQLYKDMLWLDHCAGLTADEMARIVSMLFRNPWFRRVWVLQEVWAAGSQVSIFFSADLSISWSEVLFAGKFLHERIPNLNSQTKGRLVPPWPQLVTGGDVADGKIVYHPILEMLDSVCLRFDSTDSRDKLFALLAMGEETHDIKNLPALVKPDYTKQVTWVFADFTRWHILKHRSLVALGHATYCLRSEGPTWAISHRSKFRSKSYNFCEMSRSTASADIPLDLDLIDGESNSFSLRLRGHRLGTVRQASSGYFSGFKKRFVLRMTTDHGWRHSGAVEEVLRFVYSLYGIEPGTCEPVKDDSSGSGGGSGGEINCTCRRAFDRVLTAMTVGFAQPRDPVDGGVSGSGSGSGGGSEAAAAAAAPGPTTDRGQVFPKMYAMFAKFWAKQNADAPDFAMDRFFCAHVRDILLPTPAAAAEAAAMAGESTLGLEDIWFLLSKIRIAFCKVFFVMDDGRLGLCPLGTRGGDVVVALFGGNAPFVLRALDADRPGQRPTWEFIGECFVHDFMDGKIVRNIVDTGRESEVFDLR